MRSSRMLLVLALSSLVACAPLADPDDTASDEEGLEEGDDGLATHDPADECGGLDDQCKEQPCGTPCEGPYASPLPTACDGNGECVVQPSCGVDDQCKDQPCGTPCEGPYASPLPTACDGHGECVVQPTCESYDCDQTKIICDIPIVPCDEGQIHSVNGACYGECVPVTSCKCDPADPSDCPEGYVCWANTGHCGPYVTD